MAPGPGEKSPEGLEGSRPSWLAPYRWPIAFVLVAIILGNAIIYTFWRSQPPPLMVTTPSGEAGLSSLTVYVSGAVEQPGLYRLRSGDRAAEAVAAAGGPTADADTAAINLALRIQDGMQIHVPRVGEAPLSSEVGKISINRANQRELESLPGIGPVIAQRIIDYREQQGPFQSIEDLQILRLVNQVTYEAIKDKITVR